MSPKHDCVCDTSALNCVTPCIKDFEKYMIIHIPYSMAKGKECRSNRVVQDRIDKGHIVLHKLCKADKKRIVKMIRDTLGKKIANLYEKGRMKREAIEYECAFLAKEMNYDFYIFDGKANVRTHKLLKGSTEIIHDIVDLVDVIPVSKMVKETFLERMANINGMRYRPAIEKLKEL